MLSIATKQQADRNRYLTGLNDPKEQAPFEQVLSNYLSQLRAKTTQGGRTRSDIRPTRTSEDVRIPRGGRSSSDRLEEFQNRQSSSNLDTQGIDSSSRYVSPQANLGQDQRTHKPLYTSKATPDRRVRSGSDISDLDTTPGGPSLFGPRRGAGLADVPEEVRESLEEDFRIYTGADLKKVFRRGSLIAVFWHENYGAEVPRKLQELSKLPQNGKRGPGFVSRVNEEVVYSHKRRFVIVSERHGFSVGIPITSYGGHGLLKKKFNREEQRAHTIVYTQGNRPKPLEDEPMFTKGPICIDTSISGDTLSVSSRLYYAKPQSIDHNIKVKHLGQVIKADISTLLVDYRTENHTE